MPGICIAGRVVDGHLPGWKNSQWSGAMRSRTVAFAVFMLLASAGFTSSFAQTEAVSDKTFDWIFFAIVGIPFVLALVQLARPDWLEPMIRRRSDVSDASDHSRRY
jgi:hypothetical protein